MLRYWAIRRKICTLMKETIELGPFPVDAKESDALCEVVARSVSGCHDVIAVLDDVLAARGVHLAEGSDGQWGWTGLRIRSEAIASLPSWRERGRAA